MKPEALQELRRLYTDVITATEREQATVSVYYRGAKRTLIKVGLLTAQEIETMETELNKIK